MQEYVQKSTRTTLPAQLVRGQRLGVEPAGGAAEAGKAALHRQRSDAGVPAGPEEAHAGSGATVASSSAVRIGTSGGGVGGGSVERLGLEQRVGEAVELVAVLA